MLLLPLGATEGISVPFTGVSGTPTCDLPQSDYSDGGNYFADYFEVYEPAEAIEDLIPEGETESSGTMRMIIEIAVVSAIALAGALFFGGFI